LTAAEVQTLLNDLNIVKAIVQDIETTVNSTIPGLLGSMSLLSSVNIQKADKNTGSIGLVTVEITILKALVAPLVTPILAYATSVAGMATTATDSVAGIQGLVIDIKAIVGGLVAPIPGSDII
jgi:hypothetical protein